MSAIESPTAELQTIETRIVELLQQDRYRWQELAQLALLVRREKLYVKRGLRSFTAWIKGIAEASGRQPSLFWRYLKAAVYYLRQIESEDIERISEIQAAPEALDRLEKIERQAPRPVFEAMRDKVLAGKATVLECRQVERQYRPESTLNNRGRPLKGEEGDYNHLGRWRSIKETEKEKAKIAAINREQVGQVLRQSLEAYALTWTKECAKASFIPRNHSFYANLKIPQLDQSLESVVITRWSLAQPKDVFAVITKSCLAEFERQSDWQTYFNLCHYFCFAIPKKDLALQDAIRRETPGHVGILLIDLDAASKQQTQHEHARVEKQADRNIEVAQLPQKMDGSSVGLVYESLYDELLDWKH